MKKASYHSHDETNIAIFEDLADEFGAECDLIFAKDSIANGEHEVPVYDLDSLVNHKEIVEALCGQTLDCPIAVHSYNFNDTEIDALKQKGIIVSRTLDRELLPELRQAVLDFLPAPLQNVQVDEQQEEHDTTVVQLRVRPLES